MTTESNKKLISILDMEFEVTMPYVEGHTCNAAEAKVLNQTRRENLGNNFRGEVKKFQDQAEGAKTEEELREAFAKADAEYVFTLASAGASAKLTPVEREARSIARQYLKQELDKVGRKINTPPEGVEQEAWDDTIEAEIERLAAEPQIVKMATDIVKSRSKTASLQLGALGLGGQQEAAE